MPANPKTADKPVTETVSDKLLDTQQRNVAFLTRANEIVADAAKAIWASEMDLIRLEGTRAGRLLQTPGEWANPRSAADYSSQWHDNSDKIIAHVREISDLARKCCWDLCDLYARSIPTDQKPVA